jgi:hypothetical protein
MISNFRLPAEETLLTNRFFRFFGEDGTGFRRFLGDTIVLQLL